jgi:hypothetical protein
MYAVIYATVEVTISEVFKTHEIQEMRSKAAYIIHIQQWSNLK